MKNPRPKRKRTKAQQDAHYAAQQRRRDRNVSFVLDFLMDQTCQDCGTNDFRVLEFDHRPDEEKHLDISKLIQRASLSALEHEMGRCDVVCSNCHRIRTMERAGSSRATLFKIVCEGM